MVGKEGVGAESPWEKPGVRGFVAVGRCWPPLTCACPRRARTASHLATSPSPCSRHSMAFVLCPRPSLQPHFMKKSPTLVSQMASPRPAVLWLGWSGSWRAATRASPGASLQTGEAGAAFLRGGVCGGSTCGSRLACGVRGFPDTWLSEAPGRRGRSRSGSLVAHRGREQRASGAWRSQRATGCCLPWRPAGCVVSPPRSCNSPSRASWRPVTWACPSTVTSWSSGCSWPRSLLSW